MNILEQIGKLEHEFIAWLEATFVKSTATAPVKVTISPVTQAPTVYLRQASTIQTPVTVTVSSAPKLRTGLIIPLYIYPTDQSWNRVIAAKKAYPSLDIIAIANCNSGVGATIDANYVNGIKALQAVGVKVLGYVDTAYGNREINWVEAEIMFWEKWYGINGIFFDDMSTDDHTAAYYEELASFAHSLALLFTVGNAGAVVDSALSTVFTVTNIYENSALPTLDFQTNLRAYQSFIAYDQAMPSVEYLMQASAYFAYLYVTDATLPNPYDALPTYFEQLCAVLA